MQDKKVMLLGIWSIIAILAIIIFVIMVLNWTTPIQGAYTKSAGYLQFDPDELCNLAGGTVAQVRNIPPSQGPVVDCDLNGIIKTYPLFQKNLGVFPTAGNLRTI